MEPIKFVVLERFCEPIVHDVNEVENLVRSASQLDSFISHTTTRNATLGMGQGEEEEGSYVGVDSISGSRYFATVVNEIVTRWWHVRHIITNESHIIKVLTTAKKIIYLESLLKVEYLQTVVRNLCDRIKTQGVWEEQDVDILPMYWLEYKAYEVDMKLTMISDVLLEAISSSGALVDWLRTQTDDDAFTNKYV